MSIADAVDLTNPDRGSVPLTDNHNSRTSKYVYRFDELEAAEEYVHGDWNALRGLLGGKGANLAQMTRMGIPVPPGFTVTSEACND